MRTIPEKCKDVNAVGAFCDCIAEDESVDKAAQAFCRRPDTVSDRYASGDDLRELKKALLDLEGK
jgi:hypothetical protein